MTIWGHVVGINDDNYTTCHVCETPRDNSEFGEGSITCSLCLGDITERSSKWGCDSCRNIQDFDYPVTMPESCKCGDGNFKRVYSS